MKHIFVASAILLGLSLNGFAMQDPLGSERPSVWRSSRTSVAENFVLLATSSIHLHAIICDSPTVNTLSFIAVYNRTQNANGATFNFNVDTAALMYTNMTALTFTAAVSDDVEILVNTEWPKKTEYDINLASGAVINKVGGGPIGATIQILWDFTNTRDANEQRTIVPYKP